LDRVSGLQAVFVTDTYGVPLIQSTTGGDKELEDLGRNLSATFAVSSEQASKLKMGANENIVAFYSDLVAVHINHTPLCITLLADEDEANVGVMLGLSEDLKKVMEPLRKSVLQMGDELNVS